MTHATFIPGAAGQGGFWRPVAERLPPTWQTLLIDLPGLGTVPGRADVSSYHDLADLVAASIPTPTVLVAQSMGGFIALEVVLQYPQLVTHLVLVALSGGVDMSVHRAVDWRADYAVSFPSAQPWARERVPDLSHRLHEIAVPVLLVWAARDPISPLSVANALECRIRGASLLTFDTDDHWVAPAHAKEIATAIVNLTGAEMRGTF